MVIYVVKPAAVLPLEFPIPKLVESTRTFAQHLLAMDVVRTD